MFNAVEALGVTVGASEEEVRSAYRKAALRQHPNKTCGDGQGFFQLKESFAVLLDPVKKTQHLGTIRPVRAGVPSGCFKTRLRS